MATPRVRPEAPAGETCPGLAPTAGSGRVSKPHGAVSFMSPPRAGDAWGEKPDLVGLEAEALKGPALQPHRRLQPTHLFPFGSRVSFEAGESWGALWGRRGAQSSCPQPRPPPPPPGPPGERPDSPWVPGGHRGPELQGDLVHPETQSTLHVSPALAVPRPLPQQPPHPGATHHWAGDPSKAIGPRLPGGPLGADGASLPRRAFQAGFSLQRGQRGAPMLEATVTPAQNHHSETVRSLGENPACPRHAGAAPNSPPCRGRPALSSAH